MKEGLFMSNDEKTDKLFKRSMELLDEIKRLLDEMGRILKGGSKKDD